jgi:deoxyribose-phosphate aldolase
MPLRPEELAKTLDVTLLDPAADDDDIVRLTEQASEHHSASVCVLPVHVSRAAGLLRGADVKVCAVVGLPFGAEPAEQKTITAQRCLVAGAGEFEVVLNVPAMLSGDFRLVRDEVAHLLRALRMSSVNGGRGAVLVKAVLETGQLDDPRKKLACRILERAGIDFAQTSAGFDTGRATVRDVELLRECLPEAVGVKAAGGIATAAEVEEMLAAGAARVGIADAADVLSKRSVREPV